jgi:hypothetical protein
MFYKQQLHPSAVKNGSVHHILDDIVVMAPWKSISSVKSCSGKALIAGGGVYASKAHLAQLAFTAIQRSIKVYLHWKNSFCHVSWLQVLLDQCWHVPSWEVQVDMSLEAESQDKEFTTILPSITSLNQYIKHRWILCLIKIILKFKYNLFQGYIMCSVIMHIIDWLKRVVIVLQF